jgi:hypothetical protein
VQNMWKYLYKFVLHYNSPVKLTGSSERTSGERECQDCSATIVWFEIVSSQIHEKRGDGYEVSVCGGVATRHHKLR